MRRFNVLSSLLYLLAFVLGVATVLIWTIDEAPNHYERGWLMCGLCLTVLFLGLGLQWLFGRPAPPPRPGDTGPTPPFHPPPPGPALPHRPGPGPSLTHS